MFFTTFIKGRFWLLVFILAVVYFVVLIRNDLVRNSGLKEEKEKVTGSLSLERSRQESLKNRLKMLDKASYVEMLAREKLGVVERGEHPYKVIVK